MHRINTFWREVKQYLSFSHLPKPTKIPALAFVCMMLTVFAAMGQSTYYFDIVGSAVVCADGTTQYVYSNAPENATWTISGGSFIGGNTGESITATWSTMPGSLSATGGYTNCWLDIEQSPPVYMCDPPETYISNPFNVSASSPAAPVALTALSITTTSFTARWNAAASATSYRIDVSTASNFATYVSGYADLSVAGTSVSVTGLAAGGTYYYRVQAVNCNGASGESNVIQVPLPPVAPVMNAAANISYNSLLLSWNSVTGATAYYVDVATSSSFGSPVHTNYTVAATQWQLDNLEPGVTYYFRVQATNQGSVSAESNVVSAATLPPPPIGGTEICVGSTYAYYGSASPSCPPSTTCTVTIGFTVTGGNVIAQGTDYVFVTWTSATGNVTVSTSHRVCWPDLPGAPCETTTDTESIDGAQHVVSLYSSQPTSVCEGQHVVLTANSGTGLTYQWKKDGSPVIGSASTYTVGTTNSASETGNYKVVVTKAGCPVESSTLYIEIKPRPTQPTVSTTPIEIIPGATLLEVADPSTTVQWKKGTNLIGGATQLTYLATGSDNYYVVTTGANGCSSTSNAVSLVGNPKNFTVSNAITVPGITTEAQLYALQLSQNQFLQSTQYVDGAGRPSQSVATKSSPITTANPARKDVVGFNEFDAMGREAKSSLGFVSLQSNGLPVVDASTAQLAFYLNPNDLVANDSIPSALTEFETSPISRPIKQGDVGKDWQPSVAPKSMSYGANVSTGTDAIQLYSISGSLPVSTTTYPAGVLSVTTATNEQGVQSQSVASRDGRKVVTRTKVGSAWAETYYVYDARDQLRFVLPPELMKLLRQASNFSPTQQQVDAWAYQSVYDNDGREVETKGPGTGWVYTIYDTRDRVVLTQDARQRLTNDWSYTKYDALDRPVISGIYNCPSSMTRANMQAQVDALSSNAGYQNIPTQAGIVTGTEDSVFPDGTDEPLVISYYDDYTTCAPCGDTNLQFVQESWSDSLDLSSAKYNVLGSKIASKVRILDSLAWLNTVSYYNKNGEIVQVVGTNHMGGRDRVSTLMDFAGKVLEERQAAIGYNSGGISTIRKWFTYDHAGRLEKTFHKINNQPEVMISKLEYNEIGQVIRKRLHSEDNGATFLQNIDFRYNIRGWMTHMNNLPVDDADDYYGMELAYNGAVPGGGGNPTRKDGMITAVNWKQDLSEKRKLYNFTYDDLGQLNAGAYKAGIRTPGSPPTYTWGLQPDFYNESGITYDYNGNIKTLNRNAGIYSPPSYTATPIDQLTYDYTTYGGNQLGKVTEGLATANKDKGFKDGTNTGDDYAYDINGALLYDKNKAIDSIKYYFNDRVKRVKFGSGAGALAGHYMTYKYDAAGLKLRERYYNAVGVQQARKDYVGGIELVNGKVLQVAFEEGRITAPSGVNYVDDDEAGSTGGFTAQNATLIADYFNSQSYLRVTCTSTTNPGVYPIATTEGNNFPVKAGESYTFQVLGYQHSGTSARLYVKTNLGDLIWQGAALPVGSANEAWTSVSFTIPDSATWVNVGVRWSAPSVNHRFYLNRIALYKTDFEYNYFLYDQVGSPRAVLQTKPATVIHWATMETENHADENTKWNNLDATKYVVNGSANATPGGNQAIRMNSAYRIGPAKSFKVFPGDIITGSVAAYFTSTSGYTAATPTTMAAALYNVLGAGTAAIDGGISTAYNTSGNPLIALGGFGGSTFPSGYLNYILFDENYVPIRAKSFPVQNLPSTRHSIQFDQPLEIKELGYLFVYLSYDNNQSNLHLYFDDLKVIVDESPLIQVNNYYPFGMISNTWLREGEINNAKLFQGKELISQTGWHDFGSRMYWADLGRWFSTDPQKQFSSPYVGMGNMPSVGVDPDGEFVFFLGLGLGLISGYVSGEAAGLQGLDLLAHTLASGVIGGLAGGAGQAVGTALTNTTVNAALASGLAGVAAGGVGGFYGAALNGRDPFDGFWRGATSGLVGGSLGASITGGFGAFVGGSAAGATSAALNEADANGILTGALIGGGVSWGTNAVATYMKLSQRTDSEEWNSLPLKDKYRANRVYQKTIAHNREYGYADNENGDYTGMKKGTFTKSTTERKNKWNCPIPNTSKGYRKDHTVSYDPPKGNQVVDIHSHVIPTSHSDADLAIQRLFGVHKMFVINKHWIQFSGLDGASKFVGTPNQMLIRNPFGFF